MCQQLTSNACCHVRHATCGSQTNVILLTGNWIKLNCPFLARTFVERKIELKRNRGSCAGGDDSLGKRIHNDLTRAKLGWQPRYHSFADFIQQYQPEKAEAKA
jgi:hypothetical protein